MLSTKKIHFFAAEKVTLMYMFLTSLVLLFLQLNHFPVLALFRIRVAVSLAILLLAILNSFYDLKLIRFTRFLLVGVLLSYWYPETFDINRYLPNYDYLLAYWEQSIFGFQPSILFRQLYPQNWVSELMNMGYFSYYFLIIGTCLFFFVKNRHYFEKFFFKIMFAFFVFYLIYILFPSSGPQFYFAIIGEHNAAAGLFPNIADYFSTHNVHLRPELSTGVFKQMVELTQQLGERPTAAFPSSHVGISSLIMLMVFRKREFRHGFMLLPFYFFLVLSTVYIQAHFLIDAVAGLVGAYVLDILSSRAYDYFVISKGLRIPVVVRSRDIDGNS